MFGGELAVAPPHPERTVPRRVVNFQAYVRESGARVVPVTIEDISTDGCRIRSEETFETATLVWVKVQGLGAQRARIAWHKGGSYGCEFDTPLAQEVVDELCGAKERQLRRSLRSGSKGFGRSTAVVEGPVRAAGSMQHGAVEIL